MRSTLLASNDPLLQVPAPTLSDPVTSQDGNELPTHLHLSWVDYVQNQVLLKRLICKRPV